MQTYINIMIVFLLSGLWHGANWTFILWGACHGIFSVITKRYKTKFERLHPAFNWIITFLFINVTWVIFRADSIRNAIRLLNRVTLLDFGEINVELVDSFHLPELVFLDKKLHMLESYPHFFLAGFLVLAFYLVLGFENAYEKMKKFTPSVPKLLVTVVL